MSISNASLEGTHDLDFFSCSLVLFSHFRPGVLFQERRENFSTL
jgi:hypothetical protein